MFINIHGVLDVFQLELYMLVLLVNKIVFISVGEAGIGGERNKCSEYFR